MLSGEIYRVYHEVRKDYHNLMTEFGDIVEQIYDCIKDTNSYDKFYKYLGARGCHMKLEEMGKPTSWSDMIDMLNKTRAWDCLNYELLREIFRKYLLGNSVLEETFGQYDEKVKSFLHNTKLLDFLDVYKELLPDDFERDKEKYRTLKAKLVGNLNEITLAGFCEWCGYIKRQFRLRHYAMYLVQANNGCIILFWYISKCLEPHIREVCSEYQPDFGQAGVIEISIDDRVLYQVSV